MNQPIHSSVLTHDVLEEITKSEPEYKHCFRKLHNHHHLQWMNMDDFTILKICRVKNPLLRTLYSARLDQINQELGEPSKEMELFHGTDIESGMSIAINGFDLKYASPGGDYGEGIYFSHFSSISSEYMVGRVLCKVHGEMYCHYCIRALLICRVAIGKPYLAVFKSRLNLKDHPEYHSILPFDQLNKPENCAVFNNYQAYPEYYVELQL